MELEALANDAVDHVNSLCAPERMSKADAKEFLEIVVGRLESSIEALEEELENEGDEAAEDDGGAGKHPAGEDDA